MKKILVILTSHSELINTDSKTGVWLGEFTDPYYEFIDKGYDVILASPKGGKPPVDPRSQLTENITSSNRRFKKDEKAQKDFEFTQQLSGVKADDFDAVFFPGGHGPMGDLATDEDTSRLVLEFYRDKKPIAAVCHGPAALLSAATEEPRLLQGIDVTAFSNNEEKMVGLRDKIPFSLEDRLKSLGANYNSATIPFTSNVKVSGNLITGQNPASAEKTARELIKLLK
ncbi:type 1 glutamine amidotransferase domain-containing protein [Salinimicrobium terrae]|uniref:type 1 glutamine amidotransferase domain-containing protein n=1 Tax=Salinimicrobium terrae TaxID=470866 RepID=UPI0003F8CB84|nr:type 1 glutamine amidotransferase domain-containing protein [Salinimicrobium terrae]